jgi:hypothetical protein
MCKYIVILLSIKILTVRKPYIMDKGKIKKHPSIILSKKMALSAE